MCREINDFYVQGRIKMMKMDDELKKIIGLSAVIEANIKIDKDLNE